MERTRHPRLNGADLYVARFGSRPSSSPTNCCVPPSTASSITATEPKLESGSLHDELLNPHPRTTESPGSPPPASAKMPSVHESRPCYRCISYMNSVGIRRVFWTNDAGKWEGAKVRDLVDALDNLCFGEPGNDTAALKSIFVTKHEVLMLRRTMGG